jgi:hypothetical protein
MNLWMDRATSQQEFALSLNIEGQTSATGKDVGNRDNSPEARRLSPDRSDTTCRNLQELQQFCAVPKGSFRYYG